MGKTRPSELNGQHLPTKTRKSKHVKDLGKKNHASTSCIRLVDPVAGTQDQETLRDVLKAPVTLADASTQTPDFSKSPLEALRDDTEQYLILVTELYQALDASRPALVLPRSPPTPEDFQVCAICSCSYDGKLRLPICFPCGHTLCKMCTGKVRSGSRYTCPYDRREFTTACDLLPINQLLLHVHEDVQKRKETCEVHSHPVFGFCLADRTALCEMCMFDHKDHDCCLIESPSAESQAKANLEALKTVKDKAICRLKYWEQAILNFQILFRQFSSTSLSAFIELKRVSGVMMVETIEEIVFKHTLQLLYNLLVALQQLTEKLNLHIAMLTNQIDEFPRLSLFEKLKVEVRDVYDSHEVLEFLQHLSYVTEQVNTTYLPLVRPQWPLIM